MADGATNLIYVVLAFVLTLALTPIVRAFARRTGAVAKPKADRWHALPTAMLGGVAIFLPTIILSATLIPFASQYFVVFAASAWMFALGLVDDCLHIKPYQKLIGQIMGASLVTYYGLTLPWTSAPPVNMMLTILWLVGITNAVNLLDNMDGLAAGIAAIAAVFLGVHFLVLGQTLEATIIGVFAAALVGFLIYNSNPASIFMGDCGSMFVGFFLASWALLSASTTGGRSRSFLPVLAVPVLTLVIPIFDTTFVTILRKLSGRAASQGGRDHTSHRLVALGLSERRAVWLLYALAASAGVIALALRDAQLDVGIAAIIGFTVVLTVLGAYLAGVKVYDETNLPQKPMVAIPFDFSHKQHVFAVLLDVVLVTLAYYSAYVLFFGSLVEGEAWRLFGQTLPVILFVKMAALAWSGVYRRIWRYTSVGDAVVIVKAMFVGSIGSILVLLFAFRFQGFSRTVFVLDGVLLLALIASSRVAFRVFRQMLPASRSSGGRRTLIYGAGDAGELLLREVANNETLAVDLVGFIDDDPSKKGKVLHGLRVFAGNGNLRNLCEEQQVEEIIIASRNMSAERVAEIKRDCQDAQVTIKRMKIEIEELDSLIH